MAGIVPQKLEVYGLINDVNFQRARYCAEVCIYHEFKDCINKTYTKCWCREKFKENLPFVYHVYRKIMKTHK